MFAYRFGSAYLSNVGINMDGDAHHRNVDGHRHQHEIEEAAIEKKIISADKNWETDVEYRDSSENTPAGAQILGVAILEFGVIFVRSRPCPSLPSESRRLKTHCSRSYSTRSSSA